MAMGRRKKRAQQERSWTPTTALPVGASHPFYQRLNQILDERKFDEYVETICGPFKLRSFELEEGVVCRPLRPRSLPPGKDVTTHGPLGGRSLALQAL